MTNELTRSRATTNGNAALAAGTVIVLAMIAGYLWAEGHGVSTAPLLAFVAPVVGALFLVPKVADLQRSTDRVVKQTNGVLSGVTAERDEARAELEEVRAKLHAVKSGESSDL